MGSLKFGAIMVLSFVFEPGLIHGKKHHHKHHVERVVPLFEVHSGGVLRKITTQVGRIYHYGRTKSFRFKIHPVGIRLSRKVKDSPWVYVPHLYDNETSRFNVDAFEVLQSLKKWIENNSEHLPAYDHAVAITKKDLSRFEDNLAQGIAYVRSICREKDSLSVVEDIGAMSTVSVIAHEIAHSLGAEHDGTTNNRRCSVDLNYLMVPSVTGTRNIENSFALSSCSLEQIEQFLK